MMPPAVNFHINRNCDARCRFCFATFRDVDGKLSQDAALHLIGLLRSAGLQKLNFAGGEPTLHPGLGAMLAHARQLGLVTSIVTNGSRLARLLDAQSRDLDWVGLSIDFAREAVEVALGRSRGHHIKRTIQLADHARSVGVRLKVNTVVTALNWEEDLTPLMRALRPERWKVFQVLPMDGQNDGKVAPLLISGSQFRSFVDRHAHLEREGLPPVVEDNEAMRGSYAMIDPAGRFFGNATGRHVYSAPILNVGLTDALSQVGFAPSSFEARGGTYAW